MSRCRRCEWEPGEDSTLDQHAREAAHPLCRVCSRSLTDIEPACCDRCIRQHRTLLAEVVAMTVELPEHLGHPQGQGERSNETPMPGGDALVLMGPGGTGQALSRSGDRAHLADNANDESMSAEWTLSTWAADWSETRGIEPGPMPSPWAYLSRYADWAAQQHPAYAEYVEDLRSLHARLERATGRHRKPRLAGAPCFECHGPLVHPLGSDGLERLDPTTGLPVAECRSCGRNYSPQAYRLALAHAAELASRREVDGEMYATPAAAASVVGRSERTVRDWHRRGLLRHVTLGGMLLVHLADTADQDDARDTRTRTSA